MTTATEGRVLACAADATYVEGLLHACVHDVVELDGGATGLVTALWRDRVEIALLDGSRPVPGAQARLLGRPRVPAGDDLIGRFVDGLGRPLDNGPPPERSRTHPVFFAPPRLAALDHGKRLTTGMLAYDLWRLFPAGSAILAAGTQRVAQHIFRHQAAERRVAIYAHPVAGASGVVATRLLFRESLPKCIVVESRPGSAAVARWLVPWTAMAIGAAFRDRGRDAVVMLDEIDAWLAETRRFPAFGTGVTQLGQIANHACATAGGSLSLIALASHQAVRRAAPMFDSVLNLELGLRGAPAGGKLVDPPVKLDGKGELGRAVVSLAMCDELLGMPWLFAGATLSPGLDRATKERLEEALRVRECLKFRPGMSTDCVEQLVALMAVCEAKELASEAVPAFIETFLARVRAQHADLLAGIRERRHYRTEDRAVLSPLVHEVSRQSRAANPLAQLWRYLRGQRL